MKIILFLATFTLLSFHTFAQSASQEIKDLQQHLGVGDQINISVASEIAVPTMERPLKIYIATGLDMKVYQNFVRWIEKWNQSSDSKKYGLLKIVENLDEADIILARYTLNTQANSNTASYPSVGTVYDPATKSVISRPTQRAYSYSTVPVFAYVLRRSGNNFEIISRYSDSASLGEYKNSGELLWKDFRKLLKAKGK